MICLSIIYLKLLPLKFCPFLIISHERFVVPTANTKLCTPHAMRDFDEIWFAIYCEMDYRSHVVSYYLQGNNCKNGINGSLGKYASITVAVGTAVGAKPDQKQYPRIYNLTKTYLESSPSVLKHPSGPTNWVHCVSPVALLMMYITNLRQYHVFVSIFMRHGFWKTKVYIEFLSDHISMPHNQTWYLHIFKEPCVVII